MSKLVVGLTGGIGSGKTVVSDIFAQLGVTIVDADVCARIVVEKGKPALEAIHEHFGDSVIDEKGELQRALLRQIIFSAPHEKKWLESLLHPIIFDEMLSQLQSASSPYAILVSPLLVETGQTALCNRILVVDAPEALQLSRTMSRDNNSSEQVSSIIANQSSRENRLAHADDVLVNDGDLQTLAQRIEKLHRHFLDLI